MSYIFSAKTAIIQFPDVGHSRSCLDKLLSSSSWWKTRELPSRISPSPFFYLLYLYTPQGQQRQQTDRHTNKLTLIFPEI